MLKRSFRLFGGCFFLLSFLFFSVSCRPIAIRKYMTVRDISLAKIQVKKVLTIGIRDDVSPFTNRNKETDFLEGFDIEMARLVCNEMNVMADFKVIDWSKKEELLKEGVVDCIWGALSLSQAQEAGLTVIKPYIKSCYVIGVLQDSPIKESADLDNKTLAIQQGGATAKAVDDMRRRDVRAVRDSYHKSFRFCIKELDSENVDGVVEDFLVIKYLIEEEEKPYRLLDDALSLVSYTVAFRKNDALLAGRIETIMKDLEYRDITRPLSEKWFGSNILIIGK